MSTQRKRLADTEAVAELYDVTPGTVRSWASRERWTSYGTRRSRLWDLDEIEAKHTNKGSGQPSTSVSSTRRCCDGRSPSADKRRDGVCVGCTVLGFSATPTCSETPLAR